MSREKKNDVYAKKVKAAMLKLRPLGYFEKGPKISKTFQVMLEWPDNRICNQVEQEFFVEKVLRETFDNYRCFIFVLKEEFKIMAFDHMNQLSTQGRFDLLIRGNYGYPDYYSDDAFKIISATFEVNEEKLRAFVMKEGQINDLYYLSDDVIAKTTGFMPEVARKRKAVAEKELRAFWDLKDRNRLILADFIKDNTLF